jgi:hypothetical protein
MNAINVTVFQDLAATVKRDYRWAVEDIAEIIASPHVYQCKNDLPLIKLAVFGHQVTPNGSLRHDANVLSVSGVEGDYDGGQVPIQQAAAVLEQAGIEALLYTTPSHTEEAPRWRILAPLSDEAPPERRIHFVACLNGVLEGILAPVPPAVPWTRG